MGRVLPYFNYMGMWRMIRYGFRGAQSLNRVSFLALWSFDRTGAVENLNSYHGLVLNITLF